jgi:hypothetical protein
VDQQIVHEEPIKKFLNSTTRRAHTHGIHLAAHTLFLFFLASWPPSLYSSSSSRSPVVAPPRLAPAATSATTLDHDHPLTWASPLDLARKHVCFLHLPSFGWTRKMFKLESFISYQNLQLCFRSFFHLKSFEELKKHEFQLILKYNFWTLNVSNEKVVNCTK